MDAFYERLLARAATIDELLSDDFEPLPGRKSDADLAARRLAAWCRSSASGDWSLFGRRLVRDGLTFAQVLARFATVRRKASTPLPGWIEDAIWIEAALRSPVPNPSAGPIVAPGGSRPCAFEHLFAPLIEQAEARLGAGPGRPAFGNLNESARACLRHSLLDEVSGLAAPAIYELFDQARKKAGAAPPDAPEAPSEAGASRYRRFVAAMRAGGFHRLFDDKPVLLRLIAGVTRQWIDSAHEFLQRLEADLAAIRRDILRSRAAGRVARIDSGLSDPHNGGRCVRIIGFEDGSQVVYKPKDLRLDVAWHNLVERLNRAGSPIALRAVRALARDGYGWTEFVAHAGCSDQEGCNRFFRRAGAWLALFHCFAATDMHEENVIAAGDEPVPIDLEMILQAAPEEHKSQDPEGEAFDAASEIVANSVMAVGLLAAYGRPADGDAVVVRATTAGPKSKAGLEWSNINSDAMRPEKSKEGRRIDAYRPYVARRYARLGDHIGHFVSGFEEYAQFLRRRSRDATAGGLFAGFAGLPVRRVVRPTRFYDMLLQRLKDHRTMDDGAVWSAQADFIARLADWQQDSEPLWPLQRAERGALLALNVPYFVSLSDGTRISDATGCSIHTAMASGMDRARARVESFDERDIAWQVEVIQQSTNAVSRATARPGRVAEPTEPVRPDAAEARANEIFSAEADRIAADLFRHAVRRRASAAWIGLEWRPDADVSQLVCLGPELYSGACGIALFLAAHAAVAGCDRSAELARAGIAHLRKTLRSRNAARMVRSLGIGAAAGLGSIVYALTVISTYLHDEGLRADAHVAADLFSDDLIAADKRLDIIGGSAGAILGLLRLHRDSSAADVLARATKCGEHLLGESRVGPQGRRSWVGQGFGRRALNGLSHGAAGFAYALASLAAATGREEFARAAAESMALEDSSYDPARHNWPDLRRAGEPAWLCQWCYGAAGIGLGRIAMARWGTVDAGILAADIRNAADGVTHGSSSPVDTLCCGRLGNIEFLCEAAGALRREDLRQLASQRLMAVLQAAAAAGDYRWDAGSARFNLGLFRGLAGVGYTMLRRVDDSLANVIIWE